MVRVCTHGNSSSATLGDFKQTYVQVLPIGVSVDLHRFIEPGRLVKDRFPVRAQTETIIVNPAARVAENLNVRIAKSSEITFGLVFFAPQRGMERAENDIKRTQSRGVHKIGRASCREGTK